MNEKWKKENKCTTCSEAPDFHLLCKKKKKKKTAGALSEESPLHVLGWSTKGNFKRGFSKRTVNFRVGACLKIKGLKNIFAPAIQNEGLYFPK